MRLLVFSATLAAGFLVTVSAQSRAVTMTDVSYIGPDYGLWSVPSNWSTSIVPANTDTNHFNVTIANRKVIFDRTGSTTVDDLALSNTLQLSAACNLTVASQLACSNASINANGGNLTANGSSATATSLSLNASGGAQVVLPALTQINENVWPNNTLQANGAGSLLDLSQVTAITATNGLNIQTSSGGKVDLRNLASLTQASGQVASLKANSGIIDVSSIGTGATGNGGINDIQLSNAGTVLWGSPTTLGNLTLTVTGTGNTIDLAQVATATSLSLNASGGAQVVLPALTQISENVWPNSTLQANGAGSLLDLSQVTAITATNGLNVQTSSGGKVDLRNLAIINSALGQTVNFNCSGGTIDASKLSPGAGSIQVRSGGSLLLGNLSLHSGALTLADANSVLAIQHDLTADGTASLSLASGTTVSVGGNFLNALTDETRMTASAGNLRVTGLAAHMLEVAGRDLGSTDPANNGNFGLGRLVVGLPGESATVRLVDLFDNGNRLGNQEALYLFGNGNGDGLSLVDGSLLVLNHLNVYDRIGGNWVSLQSLLAGRDYIAFDGGYISQETVAVPEPSSLALLAVALGLILSMRRKRKRL